MVLPQAASAHHPELSGDVDRPCGDDADRTATVTARSDRDWNKDWRSRHRLSGDNYGAVVVVD